jgi:putative transposase
MLDQSMANVIPSSTLHHWKKIDLSEIFGLNYSLAVDNNIDVLKTMASHKKLLKITKALYHVYMLYSFIIHKTVGIKSVMGKHKDAIVRVIIHILPLVGLKRARNAFGLSPQLYNYWKRSVQCVASPIGICRKIVYNQLTAKEVGVIKQYLTEPAYLNWPVVSVYHKMIRDGAAYMGLSTFYLYARIMNLTGLHRRPKALKYGVGIRAFIPFEILHMDITLFETSDKGRVYVSVIVDNYSRFVLGWKMALHKTASLSLENLKEVCEKYHLHTFSQKVKLMVDGGSENKGEAEVYLNTPGSQVEKLVAQTDISFSNSMVESIHQTIKKYYIPRSVPLTYIQLNEMFAFAVDDYNNYRPHNALNGLIPAEALSGNLPNLQANAVAIKQAISNRIIVNMNQLCNKCLPGQ